MAHRPLRRVLAETTLGRKLRLFFGISLMVLIVGSFLWYGSETANLVNDGNRRVGKAFVRNALKSIHYETWSDYHDNPEYRGSMAELFNVLPNDDYEWYVILPQDPQINPEGINPPQDEIERAFYDEWRLAALYPEDNESKVARFKERLEDDEYLYYQPVFASSNCIICHTSAVRVANPNLKEGDFMAIVRVKIPNAETAAARKRNLAILWTIAIVTVFLAMVALYVIVRYLIVRPLTHLREVSDAISRGNIQKRVELKTGDEFEKLGNAFNRMMRYMVEAQLELRNVNDDLDQKVDQLAQANMRLYQMNRLKSDFLATVSHELRTPLNSIIGFSEVLSSIPSLDDKQQRYVDNIQRSGRMLLEMINDILDLAKIESGKMKVRLSEFSIKTLIGAQCDMARPLTERKNIDLICEIAEDLPPLYQDQGKLQQVLSNLLSNAIKFTPEGGRIIVRADRDQRGNLELVVSDTGVGIAEEDHQAIFEKFRQGASVLSGGDAMTREYTGTGLGLSIVKELCKLLGGEVSLESQLGNGSSFTVQIPWRREEEQQLDSELVDDLDSFAQEASLDMLRAPARELPAPNADDAQPEIETTVAADVNPQTTSR